MLYTWVLAIILGCHAGVGRQQIGALGSVVAYAIVGLPVSFFLSQDVGVGLGLPGIWLGGTIASVSLSLFNIVILMMTDWQKMAIAARLRAGAAGSDSGSPESGSEEDSDSGSDSTANADSDVAPDAGEVSVSHLTIDGSRDKLEQQLDCSVFVTSENVPIGSPGAASDAPLIHSPHGSPLGEMSSETRESQS